MDCVVVVGASLAGLRAAEALRREGFDGRLVMLGAEEHAPYQRPPLSKQFLAGTWDRGKLDLRVKDDLRIELRTRTRATALDLGAREVIAERDGREERVRFDGLVIATGATPRELPHDDDDARPAPSGLHTLRTLEDCCALRDALCDQPRVVVIGGGFIGSELAATCRDRGASVTVIEPAPTLLHRALGPSLGEFLGAVHRDHGTDLRLCRSAAEVLGNGRVEGVRLDDGDVVAADVVVVALGVVPATAWLDGSGVQVDDGVVCDSRCRAVGVDGVVAAGDVARWEHDGIGGSVRIEHFDNARLQAATAAAALLHGDNAEPYRPVPWFWSDQHDIRLQMLGVPQPDDEVQVVEGSVDERSFVAAYGRDGRTVAVVTVNLAARTAQYRAAVEGGVAFPPLAEEARRA
jgi:NADPH-dependent 2,4-dienoyl-CoA reductase/sulfur reductase-like enzyme